MIAQLLQQMNESDTSSAALLSAFRQQQGEAGLARNLLLLGSGYLEQSLGHSVSCTAFMLLEMMERSDLDPWPALATLADYFCKGQFHTTPPLPRTPGLPSEETLDQHMLRATSGSGIVNLHHTITRYSIEQVRHLLSEAEYAHLISCWIEFMGPKSVETPPSILSQDRAPDYDAFYRMFSKRAEKPALSCLARMISTEEGRKQMGRYLIKGLCDRYQGLFLLNANLCRWKWVPAGSNLQYIRRVGSWGRATNTSLDSQVNRG